MAIDVDRRLRVDTEVHLVMDDSVDRLEEATEAVPQEEVTVRPEVDLAVLEVDTTVDRGGIDLDHRLTDRQTIGQGDPAHRTAEDDLILVRCRDLVPGPGHLRPKEGDLDHILAVSVGA